MKKLSRLTMPLAAVPAVASCALAQQKTQPEGQGDQSKLVEMVRNATQQYQDVTKATAAGYGPALGCLSGSDHGAMGIHYVNGPNRYGLPAFFELHVWTWGDNPKGPFVDWNDHVTCAHQ